LHALVLRMNYVCTVSITAKILLEALYGGCTHCVYNGSVRICGSVRRCARVIYISIAGESMTGQQEGHTALPAAAPLNLGELGSSHHQCSGAGQHKQGLTAQPWKQQQELHRGGHLLPSSLFHGLQKFKYCTDLKSHAQNFCFQLVGVAGKL